jgi:hypothetical protein
MLKTLHTSTIHLDAETATPLSNSYLTQPEMNIHLLSVITGRSIFWCTGGKTQISGIRGILIYNYLDLLNLFYRIKSQDELEMQTNTEQNIKMHNRTKVL